MFEADIPTFPEPKDPPDTSIRRLGLIGGPMDGMMVMLSSGIRTLPRRFLSPIKFLSPVDGLSTFVPKRKFPEEPLPVVTAFVLYNFERLHMEDFWAEYHFVRLYDDDDDYTLLHAAMRNPEVLKHA